MLVVVTVLLVTVAVALVCPAAIVTLAGIVATAVLLLEKVVTAPPVGAALVKLTVAWEVFPPVTAVGLRVIEEREAGGVAFLVTNRAAVRIASR